MNPERKDLTMTTAKQSIAASDGTSLFVRSWGKGLPLMFMSGWTLSSNAWAYQMAPLSEQGFRCVAYDRRGHGRSGDPSGGYDFDTLADDVEVVLAGLDLTRVILVAHSFAAGEAVRYITRHGTRRLLGLLLLAPAATPFLQKTDDNPLGIDADAIEAVRAQFSRSFPDWVEANAEPYFTPGTSRQIKDWTVNMMLQTSLQGAIACSRIQMSTDFRAELKRIDLPTLVIHGDRDASAPLEITGRPTAELIPHAELCVYEGAPHGLYFTHRERLNADLARFARTCAAR
ncbi:MAG TPA: alpha/beta hydrolase [Polyangiaceae bacterium]|nr:alpha/beta hydrolase [Polyangiaceae bacterium]